MLRGAGTLLLASFLPYKCSRPHSAPLPISPSTSWNRRDLGGRDPGEHQTLPVPGTHPQWDVFYFAGPAEPRAGRKEELEARPCCPLTFDDSDVLYLVAGVVVGGLQLAHVDPLIAGGEAVQVEAHQVLVHGDVGSVPVDVLGDADGALDDVLPVVLGEAEFVGQGVAGLVLIAAVHAQALAQQAGAQVPDHLAVRSLQHWDRQAERGKVSAGDTRAAPPRPTPQSLTCQDDSNADGGVHLFEDEMPRGGCQREMSLGGGRDVVSQAVLWHTAVLR